MKKYTTLLFDADETLLDFISAEAEAIRCVCRNFGITYNEEVRITYSKINKSLWKQLEKGLVTRDIIKIRRFEQFAEIMNISAQPAQMAATYLEALSCCGMLLEGAKELCLALSEKYDMYIVTNGLGSVQKGRLARSGILPFFSGVFISEEAESQKPDIKFFNYVFERIPEKNKENICIIGDSMSSDILGGINAGIDTCFFSPNAAPEPYTPTYTARNYDEIIEIFTGEK